MTNKLRPNAGKEELTSISGTKALTFSFEAPTTLLSLILGSVRRGAFRLLNGHCRLEVGHLDRQQTDLRLISRPLFPELLLGRVNPSNSVDLALVELHLCLLGASNSSHRCHTSTSISARRS